jgi:hypothetical protein
VVEGGKAQDVRWMRQGVTHRGVPVGTLVTTPANSSIGDRSVAKALHSRNRSPLRHDSSGSPFSFQQEVNRFPRASLSRVLDGAGARWAVHQIRSFRFEPPHGERIVP